MYSQIARGAFEEAMRLHDELIENRAEEVDIVQEIESCVQELGRRLWIGSRSLEQSYAFHKNTVKNDKAFTYMMTALVRE